NVLRRQGPASSMSCGATFAARVRSGTEPGGAQHDRLSMPRPMVATFHHDEVVPPCLERGNHVSGTALDVHLAVGGVHEPSGSVDRRLQILTTVDDPSKELDMGLRL